MFGKRFPSRQRGRPVTPAAIRAPDKFFEQLGNLRGAGGTLWTPFGPQITQPPILFRLGITGSGGIPALKGSQLGYSADVSDATISLGSRRGTANLATSSSQFDGYNLSSHPVAGNATTIYMLLWSIWICIWEDCPPGS